MNGFGTDKKKGSTLALSRKTLLENFPSVKAAFNSLPNAKLVSTTYTSNFAVYEESGGELVVSKWNNLISDDQYLRQTNSANYPAISTANSLSGKPSLRFLFSDSLGSVAQESGYTGRTIFIVTRQNVIDTLTDKILLYDSVGDIAVGGSTTQKGFGVGICDSLNGGSSYRLAVGSFYRTGTPTPSNYSGPGGLAASPPNFGDIGLFVWKQELDVGNRSLEVSLRNENLSNIFSATVTPAALSMTNGTWDGLFSGDTIPAAYLNICFLGSTNYDIEYYFISIYHSALSDTECYKVFSIIKNMYGL